MLRFLSLGVALVGAVGCSVFASTPALPGERDQPAPPSAPASSEQPDQTDTSTGSDNESQASLSQSGSDAVPSAPPRKRKRRKKRRKDRTRGWSLAGDYVTVVPNGFLEDHLGVAHGKDAVPLGEHPVVPGAMRTVSRPTSNSFIDGESTRWGLKGGARAGDAAELLLGYKSDERTISVSTFAQTRCTSLIKGGTLRRDKPIPEGSLFVPFEVCYGYAVVYELTMTEGTLYGEGRADLGNLVAGKLGLRGVLGKIAAKFLNFEGDISGFREKYSVEVSVSSMGFDIDSSKCDATKFLEISEFLACHRVTRDGGFPIFVRWRRLEFDQLSAASEPAPRGQCQDFRLSKYRYQPPEGTEGSFLISIYPTGGSSRPRRGAKGELYGVTASAGDEVSYAVRRRVPGEKRPELLEEGVFTIPKNPRKRVLSSHTGRLKVSVDCLRIEQD